MKQIFTDYSDLAFEHEGVKVARDGDGWAYITETGEPIRGCPASVSARLEEAYQELLEGVPAWDLDSSVPEWTKNKALTWISEKGYDKGVHPLLKVGDIVQFRNDNGIPMTASIKGIDGNNLYVYWDCYWFPIPVDRCYGVAVRPVP